MVCSVEFTFRTGMATGGRRRTWQIRIRIRVRIRTPPTNSEEEKRSEKEKNTHRSALAIIRRIGCVRFGSHRFVSSKVLRSVCICSVCINSVCTGSVCVPRRCVWKRSTWGALWLALDSGHKVNSYQTDKSSPIARIDVAIAVVIARRRARFFKNENEIHEEMKNGIMLPIDGPFDPMRANASRCE